MQTKTFVWKRDYAISSKLQMLNVDQDDFRKPDEDLEKEPEKEQSLNNPYNFQRPFNFSLLKTFKLS